MHKLYLFATYSKKYQSFNLPKNIVTLNSEIILVSDIQKKQLVKIILPGETSSKHDISIYSPIGIACLGAKENDYVFVNYKNTCQKLLIEKIVYQPKGDMELNL